MFEPVARRRVKRTRDADEPVVVVPQAALEDRLVVSDAIPERPQSVEHLEEFVPSLRPWVEHAIEVRPPERLVVRVGEEPHPESEGQLGDDASRCRLLPLLVQPLSSAVYLADVGWTQDRPVLEPALAVGGRQRVVHCVP